MDITDKVIPFELYPTGFIEALLKQDIKLSDLLCKTGINESMLGRSDLKISYQQQTQLIKNALEHHQGPGLGLLVGMDFDWSYFGTVGGIVNCSPSLKYVGDALRRFLPLAQPFHAQQPLQPYIYVNKNGIVTNPMNILTSVHCDDEIYLFEREYRLAMTLRLYELCGNKSVDNSAITVHIDYPSPSYAHLYRQLGNYHFEFNKPHSAILCHYTYIVTPWRKMRTPAYQRLLAQCERELQTSPLQSTMKTTVQWYVSLHYNENVTLESVADSLSMTPRSLARKLASENTSYRQIAHQVRMEITSLHLKKSDLSVEEVAELMGFSGASSLRRAIKNWSGETVKRLRSAPLTIKPPPYEAVCTS